MPVAVEHRGKESSCRRRRPLPAGPGRATASRVTLLARPPTTAGDPRDWWHVAAPGAIAMVTSMSRPHVVIIGSGFGGIRAAKGLTDVDITLIDANNFHTFQPLLYQVATAGLDADDIGFPIRRIFRRNPSVTFVLGEVTAIDLDGKSV